MQFFKCMNIFKMSYGKWVEYYHEGATLFSIPLPSLLRGGFDNYFGGEWLFRTFDLKNISEGCDLFFSGSIVNLQHPLLGAGSCGY